MSDSGLRASGSTDAGPSFPPLPRIPPRTGRGGFMGRRGAGGGNESDDAIRLTDNDAAVARASAVRAGYINDPFAAKLLQAAEAPLRPPLINIGTHHRTYTIDMLAETFLSAPFSPLPDSPQPARRNVLSLGAGSDSRFWRLRQRWQDERAGSEWPVGKWVEVDFEEPSRRKASTVGPDEVLSKWTGAPTISARLDLSTTAPQPPTSPETTLDSPSLALVSYDLRSSPASLVDHLKTLVPLNEPLLIIAELVFAYMLPAASNALLSALVAEWSGPGKGGLAVVTYEMLYSGDNFGKVMVQNLKARNLTLAGLAANPDCKSQATRLLRAGCSFASALDLKSIRHELIPRDEMARIAGLEFLDEVEELELVLEHYCIACGVRPSEAGGIAWEALRLGPVQTNQVA